MTLLLLVGIPGSGKSTWAASLAAGQRYRHVSTDAIRAELYGHPSVQGDWRRIWQRVLEQWREGAAAIAAGELEGVIYDATNARRRQRREAIAAASQLGFSPITLVWFDVPLGVALERNRGRSHPVPDEVIAAMHRQLQGAPPALSEGVERVMRLRPGLGPIDRSAPPSGGPGEAPGL